MNFQSVSPVGTSAFYLNQAFRRARLKTAEKNFKGSKIHRLQKKLTAKIDGIADSLHSSFQKILDDFPQEGELTPFYRKLLRLTLDYSRYKKSFGAVYWAKKKVSELQRTYARIMSKAQDFSSLRQGSAQFYGRISSVIKQINPELVYLEHSRRVLKTYPDIKEMPTVCLYGFPNVGKTTLLNQLTGSKAKVAAYAFTTTRINSGFITLKGATEKQIQVLDVPGTLARPGKMNPIEQQAELVVQELAALIVLVLDPSGTSGFSLEQQGQLLKKVVQETKTPVLVYISKQDLSASGQREKLNEKLKGWLSGQKVFFEIEEVRQEIARRI